MLGGGNDTTRTWIDSRPHGSPAAGGEPKALSRDERCAFGQDGQTIRCSVTTTG